MNARDAEFLTIAETAALLKVDRSTVRRWIDKGTVPAYRVGGRTVRLRRNDLDRVIRPVNGVRVPASVAEGPRLGSDQQRQGLAAVRRARRLQEQALAERGGVPYPPSWEILAELRDERSRDLS